VKVKTMRIMKTSQTQFHYRTLIQTIIIFFPIFLKPYELLTETAHWDN